MEGERERRRKGVRKKGERNKKWKKARGGI